VTSSVETSVRPAYRPYRARVVGVERLGPSFRRVHFHGDGFEDFGTAGLDQRVKLLLPTPEAPGTGIADEPHDGLWYARWRAMPTAERPILRTYTVRRIREGVLTIDFVVHHDAGPAGAWAEAADLGDEIVIVGPDELSSDSRSGIDWHPRGARTVLLAGDETAAPAICSILESLHGTDVAATAFIEVPHAADAQHVELAPRSTLTWLARDEAEHGETLIDAVRVWCAASRHHLDSVAAAERQELADIDVDRELLWDAPTGGVGDFYAWMAGESSVVKTLRRLLVQDHGVDRSRVAFMGYWRAGQSERTE